MLSTLVKSASVASATGIQYVGGYATTVAASTTDQTITFGGNLTGGLASSASAGDLVVVYFGSGVGGASPDVALTIAGYTELTELFSSDSDSANLAVGYKVMGASPDTSVTLTGGTGKNDAGGAIAVSVWRGVDAALPMDVAITTATGINTALCNPPSITPSTAGAIILAGGLAAYSGGSAGTFSSSDLSGFITAGNNVSGTDATIGLGYKAWTSGAFDPAAFTFSLTDDARSSWAAVTLALRPNQNQPGPIVISQATTQNTSNGTSLVINKPTGTREGDLMVAFLGGGGGTQSAPGWSGPTGWTYVANLTTNGRPVNAIAYKVAGAGEGASYTFTATTSRTLAGTIVTYRNAAYDVIGSATNGANPLVLPEVTLSANYSYLIGFAGRDIASVTVTAPAGMSTLELDADATAPSYLIAHEGPRQAGATGTRSFTTGNSTNSNGLMAGIKPAASYTKYASYVSVGTGSNTSGTGSVTASVTTPAALPGNILLLCAAAFGRADPPTISLPSGYTQVSSLTSSASGEAAILIAYRIADGTEAATISVTGTPGNGGGLAASIVAVAGGSQSIIAGSAATGTATTTISANSVTATTNCLLLFVGASDVGTAGAPTFTPPSGYTEIADVGVDSGGGQQDGGLIVAYKEGNSAGSTGTVTATSSLSGGTKGVLISIPAL